MLITPECIIIIDYALQICLLMITLGRLGYKSLHKPPNSLIDLKVGKGEE